ncbi:hypothetical protein Tco_1421134 [Tanacetum coccineum]
MDSQIISLNEELQDMREKYNELRNGNASKNNMNDDTPMYERHEANYIQSEGHQNRNSHDSHSHQSHHDRNDSLETFCQRRCNLVYDVPLRKCLYIKDCKRLRNMYLSFHHEFVSIDHEHEVLNLDSAGTRLQRRHLYLKINVQFRRTYLTGFPAQSVRSSNAIALDSPYLLVLIIGTSQSRQHGKSESDSYYLSD